MNFYYLFVTAFIYYLDGLRPLSCMNWTMPLRSLAILVICDCMVDISDSIRLIDFDIFFAFLNLISVFSSSDECVDWAGLVFLDVVAFVFVYAVWVGLVFLDVVAFDNSVGLTTLDSGLMFSNCTSDMHKCKWSDYIIFILVHDTKRKFIIELLTGPVNLLSIITN